MECQWTMWCHCRGPQVQSRYKLPHPRKTALYIIIRVAEYIRWLWRWYLTKMYPITVWCMSCAVPLWKFTTSNLLLGPHNVHNYNHTYLGLVTLWYNGLAHQTMMIKGSQRVLQNNTTGLLNNLITKCLPESQLSIIKLLLEYFMHAI